MKITINAFAKLNLSLDIKDLLPNGYHIIETVFQSISLHDTITVENGVSKTEVICNKGGITHENNICFKALNIFMDTAKLKDNCKININKKIPLCAGLAGGSADAAAVLRALNILYNYPLSEEKLLEIGASLGADVPFCMIGGTMFASGIGEKLSPLPSLPSCDIVLIKKGSKPSTGELYKKMDSFGNYKRPDSKALIKALHKGDLDTIAKSVRNVFEEAWGDAIKPQKDILLASGALCAELSGSGPTVFGIFKKGKNDTILEKLSPLFEEVYYCEPKDSGLQIISIE